MKLIFDSNTPHHDEHKAVEHLKNHFSNPKYKRQRFFYEFNDACINHNTFKCKTESLNISASWLWHKIITRFYIEDLVAFVMIFLMLDSVNVGIRINMENGLNIHFK